MLYNSSSLKSRDRSPLLRVRRWDAGLSLSAGTTEWSHRPTLFDFNKAHERLVYDDGVIGAGFQIAHRRFADGGKLAWQPAELCQILKEMLEGRPQLVLRLSGGRWIGQLFFGLGAKGGNG